MRFIDGEAHFIYAYLDSAGGVLYVGRTRALGRRDDSHRSKAAWYPMAAGRRILWQTTDYRSAKAAEALAIRELAPRFNIQHNRSAA